jgi:hypothetical protein
VNGNNSVARAIDDAGEVAGSIDSPAGEGYPIEAVVWKDGKLTELGTFGAPGARGLALDKQGDVLVELDDKAGDSAGGVLLHGGQADRIPTLGGSAPVDQGGPLVLTGLNNPRPGRRLRLHEAGRGTAELHLAERPHDGSADARRDPAAMGWPHKAEQRRRADRHHVARDPGCDGEHAARRHLAAGEAVNEEGTSRCAREDSNLRPAD